jgi:hypothetical protein
MGCTGGTMADNEGRLDIRATFPIDDEHIKVIADGQSTAAPLPSSDYSLASGLSILDVQGDRERDDAVVLTVEHMNSSPLTVDYATVQTTAPDRTGTVVGPPFIHGIQTPTQLKVPHIIDRFPFSTRLAGHHVSVMCCTGCNGGVHDRGLVVVNSHIGGPWSAIWVQTSQSLETPYPRWQRALFAGGVISERSGSMTVQDQGWMAVSKHDEPSHLAPPPLRIATQDLPMSRNRSIETKSLDGTWVQFDNVLVESADVLEANESRKQRLTHNRITFTDESGGRSAAWLYQARGLRVQAKDVLSQLRGFVHSEQQGLYVLLSDKDEDIAID